MAYAQLYISTCARFHHTKIKGRHLRKTNILTIFCFSDAFDGLFLILHYFAFDRTTFVAARAICHLSRSISKVNGIFHIVNGPFPLAGSWIKFDTVLV